MNPASTIQNSRLHTPECHLDWFQWTIDGRFVPSLFVYFFLFHDTNLLRHISQQSSLPPMLLSTLSSKYARIVLQTEKICVITQASWLQGTSKASSGKWIKLTSRKTITYYFSILTVKYYCNTRPLSGWFIVCSRRSNRGVQREVREKEKLRRKRGRLSHLFAPSIQYEYLEQTSWFTLNCRSKNNSWVKILKQFFVRLWSI